jgi:hypothetical protein
MAMKKQNSSSAGIQTFTKGLSEDVNGIMKNESSWTQARNAINNSTVGDLAELSNEESNYLCAEAPYPIIGFVHLGEDRWAVFSTDDSNSEIGVFGRDKCTYETVVNDPCLNFNREYLIKGVSRDNFECDDVVYWSDSLNPDRVMSIQNPPWIQECEVIDGCLNCEDTDQLDCDKIRLAPLTENLCFRLEQGPTSGELLNGQYYVVGAYLVDGQRSLDYSLPSNVIGLFTHQNAASSIEVIVENADESYDEFQLVLVEFSNFQTVGHVVGTYSTRQKVITIDAINTAWAKADVSNIVLRNPIIDKSDGIYRNGKYLLRVGPTTKFDFNYQPLANQITARWQSVEYPANYYRDAGTNRGYMRDEVYAFFIRWVYNTGDTSPSFHIPGRAGTTTDFQLQVGDDSQVDIADGLTPFNWRVYNTASIDLSFVPYTLPDGGQVIAEGEMGYWESTELYDDDNSVVWDTLCGENIRHHRFPEHHINGNTATNHYNPANPTKIRIMGVQFDNIQPPVDNDGNVITEVVGYEILRSTREGNKSVIAKGLINNMREYEIPLDSSPRQGLYPNYPYNPLYPDRFLNESPTQFAGAQPNNYFIKDHEPLSGIRRDVFTFHSPETSFRDPFLSAKEVKIYGNAYGTVEGNFQFPDKHPKHKFVTDVAFILSAILGIGYATLKMGGQRSTKFNPGGLINLGGLGLGGVGAGSIPFQPVFGITSPNAYAGAYTTTLNAQNPISLYNISTSSFGGLAQLLIGQSPQETFDAGSYVIYNYLTNTPGSYGPVIDYSNTISEFQEVPAALRIIQGIPTFLGYWGQGIDQFLDLIRAWSKWRQHALQYVSHGFYNAFQPSVIGNTRRGLQDQIYVNPQLQEFGTDFRVNNLFRGRTVALHTEGANIQDPGIVDTTQQTFSDAVDFPNGPEWDASNEPEKIQKPFNTTCSSHYVAIKQRLLAQYGQVQSMTQVPVSTCMHAVAETKSPVLFGGDIYIGRFTEKNTMFFFYDWLYNLPDGAEFDYRLYKMILHPKFWMDTEPFSIDEFVSSVVNSIASFNFSNLELASDKAAFDRKTGILNLRLTIANAFIYLFNSGVRDFYVESEINVDYRDWEDADSARHYDHLRYTNLADLFNSNIIKSGNFFKYDYSLSNSKLFNNFISWGTTQDLNYNPEVAETCYIYRPDRIIYSLPQDEEKEKDFWRVFLPLNYKEFSSKPTVIKPIGKNGAMILFERESPVQFAGVDQLVTTGGTKVTIGDGGLFSQPLQNLANAEKPIEYGSCQNRLSVINTPAGLFYMSQNQGKIFQVAKGLLAISDANMKWWFATYLPYQLTKDFPDFDLVDNPLVGIGCQAVYDNKNQIIYFSKKDYILRKDILDTVEWVEGKTFIVNGILSVELGDPRYFADASWTVSYDPKTKAFISYHDWHPDLSFSDKNTFITSKENGAWVHNDNCQSYCNFYGEDYPFEVEVAIPTKTSVNTLRSIEYYMEVYKYDQNCYDRFHVLDFNFDEAIVYNTEQCSGLLRLNLKPKNNAPEIINYPIINANNIEILYSKEEQKYRFNQFWDITDDRGEFNAAAERVIFNTEANGYIRNLNPNNLNYDKFQLERKKFRHYMNTILLRRRVSGDKNMNVTIAINKNLLSPR